MKKNHTLYVLSLLCLIGFYPGLKTYGQLFQNKVTYNDSFEGYQQQDIPPNHWVNCNDGHSTVDAQPGSWNVYKHASHGKGYISMITREISSPGTVETVWAKLINPLQKDSCLTFTVDLCISNEFRAQFEGTTYFFNNPCKLRVFGFNDDCANEADRELLWESGTINHFNWRSYDVECKPKNNKITKIGFQAYFVADSVFKNSALLIDHIRPSEVDIVFEGNELVVPEGSTNIQWYYNGSPIIGATDANLPPFVEGYYQVFYTDPEGCKRITRSTFIKLPTSEIQVWPNPNQGTGELYIFSSLQERSTLSLLIYDTAGRLVHKENVSVTPGSNKKSFDFSNLAAGLYHAVLDKSEFKDVVQCRFLIQK